MYHGQDTLTDNNQYVKYWITTQEVKIEYPDYARGGQNTAANCF
jgi:hypothetical protein